MKMEGMAGDEGMEPLEGPSAREVRQPSPRDFDAKPWWARFMVISAGVVMNLLFAFAVFTFSARSEGIVIPLVGEVTEGSPAEAAGMQTGDVILRVDGRRVGEWSSVVRYVNLRPDTPIRFQVDRSGEIVNMTIAPERVKEYNELARDSVQFGRIGVRVGGPEAMQKPGWGHAVVLGWQNTGHWAGTIFDFLGRIVTGKTSSRELGGPIAIGQLSGDAARAGLWPFLTFMAIISVNLAVLNLLPIPVLDGGHILFLLLEAVRGGRPVSMKHRLRLTQIGLILVMGLMVLAFANDIMRLIRV